MLFLLNSGARNRSRQQQAQKSRDEAVSERDVAVVKCPRRRHVAVVMCRKLLAVYIDIGVCGREQTMEAVLRCRYAIAAIACRAAR